MEPTDDLTPDRQVRQTADRLIDRRVGAVVAAVTRQGAVVHGAGRLGGASAPVRAPDAGTVFEIGSVTKVFTGLVLARMVVAGTAGLDEPVRDLLPSGTAVPSRDGVEITLRDLATHSSGLPRLPRGMLLDALLHPGRPDPYRRCTAEFLLDGLARTRLGARPGRRVRYSNLGAGLLGLALAHRARTGYAALVEREVCRPLGLSDTSVTAEGPRLAQGHNSRRRPVPGWHLADLAGAGGLHSTATDLVRFLDAHLDDTGPLAEAIRCARAVRVPMNPFSWMHLGWTGHRLHPRRGGRLQVWHNGATGGFTSFVGFDPERHTGVVVLTNTARSVDRAAFDLLNSLSAAD
ncbi:CubicO group peptidase (beta-lactamase class C family) [Catenuloplanes nepalensis]|uniref:CubicO group peptidase (Beta-lactamase class C family) n=1 Tax=Catenuloplanes nepalensis TaxID=587533 RepID=A0ABT9MWF4_9ACTN|nr:serine hydrolase domain-containing protein [Catenuloplanes nepalensis]MDP9795558.1 CubicO group peptidase (beta-lactamase class C family) [Catenuloplanes nepalensis]